MRTWAGIGYLPSLIPGVLAVAGNLRGESWALGATVFVGLLCVADWFFRSDRSLPPSRSDRSLDLLLVLHVALNTAAIATLIQGVASGRLTPWRASDAALSTGLNSGISGIVVAHELIHRRSRAWRLLGVWNLLLVNYAYFYVEHIRGHHRWVGTRRDPSTARPGESVYRYLIRSIPQQFACALRIEATRLSKAGRWRYSPANFVVATTLLQVLVCLVLGLGIGGGVLEAYLRQGLTAVVLLQVVSFLQHSGLERTAGARIAPAHSWQSDRISSRFLLMELPRHADHHCHASRPYHQLASRAESPTLPLGLFGTIPLLLVPPLWNAVARRATERARTSEVRADPRGDRAAGLASPTLRIDPAGAESAGNHARTRQGARS